MGGPRALPCAGWVCGGMGVIPGGHHLRWLSSSFMFPLVTYLVFSHLWVEGAANWMDPAHKETGLWKSVMVVVREAQGVLGVQERYVGR